MSYEVRIQEWDEFCIAHCSVSHFSPSVWKDMKLTAQSGKEVYSDKPVYAVPLNTKLHDKFLSLMGFKNNGDVIDTANGPVNVWRMV